MKIKPTDIEIPHDDPFRHDLLGRETTILNLTNLLQNRESPYTMSIDASWGNGKTTLLNMWKQHLRNEGFPVASFNAWETDFTGSPLVALTSELIDALETYGEEFDLELDVPVRKIQTLLKRLVPTGVVGLVYLLDYLSNIQSDASLLSAAATGATAGLGAASTVVALNDEPKTEPQEPNTYMDAKATIDDFRSELRHVAQALSKTHDNRPLIIAIDELDRCRPSYAVELLEVAKHFFSVDNIVFVLAIDKSQLSHAIKAIYGDEFDSIGYLRRFIDLDLHLPKPEQTGFVKQALLDAEVLLNIEEFKQDYVSLNSVVRGMLSSFLGASPLSLRQIQQAIIRLGLALDSIEPGIARYFPAFALIIFLRAIDPAICHKFVQSEINDMDVSEYVFDLPGLGELRQTNMGASFEAILILADEEFRKGERESPTQAPSGLYGTYESIASSDSDSSQKPHAELVLRVFNKYQREYQNAMPAQFVGFKAAAKHIELLDEILPDDFP